MIDFPNPRDILPNVVKNKSGIERYAFLMQNLHKTVVSKDELFQKTYFGFYKVRRNQSWRITYFDYLETQKTNQNLSFETIIKYLFQKTNRVEASFTSKLLATIKPSMPIWDKFVLMNLGFDKPIGPSLNRIENSIFIYSEIVKKYDTLIESEWGKQVVNIFNENFPSYQWFTNMKKIDFFLWQQRS